MKSWHLWVGLALLVLVLLSVREGFAATATIKNPNTWDAAERTRIRAMAIPASTLSDRAIDMYVGGFWSVWDAATSQITVAQVTEYVDQVTANAPGGIPADKKREIQDLIKTYYIDQGQGTFQAARGYSAGDMDTAASSSSSTSSSSSSSSAATTEIERPSSATQSLKQEIATTLGIPLTDETSINAVVTKVQSFYDTVYLPTKATPTYTQMMGFADGVDTSTLPASIQNNFKIRLVTILQSYFTPQTGTSVSPASGGGASAGAADTSAAAGGADEGTWTGTGKNVQGPASGGQGSTDNTTGGLGVPRNYPVLYGGMQEYKSALPSSSSLGSDPMAKFLPYSRVPGDQDVYPDPYRLGKYFSTSSYSSKDAPEPAPFLADFSKFFT
jgi:hypothetical protein